MNSGNPFQIPSCFQTNWQQRRRERFKKGVIAVVIAGVVLLVGLLIQGCKTERTAGVTPIAGDVPALADTQPNAVASPEQKPISNPQPVAVAPVSQPVVSKVNAVAMVPHPAQVYLVKTGDTLTRIAKTHSTTVSAIKTLNGLQSDRIVVGAKLRIPEA